MANYLRLLLLASGMLMVADLSSVRAQTPSEAKADPSPERQAIVLFYKDHAELPADGSGPWMDSIAKVGGPDELRRLYDQVVQGHFDAGADARALDAVAEAARLRQIRPTPIGKAVDPVVDPDYQALLRLLRAPDVKLQAAAARLAGAWQMEYLGEPLAALAASGDADAESAAFDALRAIGGKTALSFFAVLARPDQRIETRCQALIAMAEIQVDAAVVQAADVLPAIDSEAQALKTWRGLLKIDRAPNALAVRLPKNLPPEVIAAGLQVCDELGRKAGSLRKALLSQRKGRSAR